MTKAQWRVFLFILFLFSIASLIFAGGIIKLDNIDIYLKVGNTYRYTDQEHFKIDLLH